MKSNKTALTIKLIALIVVFLLVAAFSIKLIFRGYSGMTSFDIGSKLLSSESYSGIKAVDSSLLSYGLSVEEHESSQTLVEIYSTGVFTSRVPTVGAKGGTLTIKQEQHTPGLTLGGGRVVIKVPKGSALDYSLVSASGSTALDAMCKNADVTSVSGSVKVSGGGETLSVASTSGSVKVSKPFKTIDVDSVSGSIKVAANKTSDSLALNSTSGSVKIMLMDNIGYTMRFGTTSGSVKDEYSGVSYRKNGSADWGDKSLSITAETVSGSIKLCDWDD